MVLYWALGFLLSCYQGAINSTKTLRVQVPGVCSQSHYSDSQFRNPLRPIFGYFRPLEKASKGPPGLRWLGPNELETKLRAWALRVREAARCDPLKACRLCGDLPSRLYLSIYLSISIHVYVYTTTIWN